MGPSLTQNRIYFGCAVFNSPFHNSRPVVLAAGGSRQATAELLDYTQPNSKWSPIASLPTDYDSSFKGAQAVTSPSGQGAIVQHKEHLYELKCELSGCSWTILPQQVIQGVTHATV